MAGPPPHRLCAPRPKRLCRRSHGNSSWDAAHIARGNGNPASYGHCLYAPFQEVQQSRPCIPRRTGGLLHHIVAIEADSGMQVTSGMPNGSINFLYSPTISLKRSSEKSTKSILFTGQHHVLDAQQGDQERMSPRLRDDTQSCIHQMIAKLAVEPRLSCCVYIAHVPACRQ